MRLFYQHYPAQLAKSDPIPLVILHGLLGASGNWHTLARSVFSERRDVYALDQRNHGRSPHADAFDYAVLADDLLAFLDERGLERVHVLGHSMGGKTAMQFALTYPDRVDGLVIVDIAPKAYDDLHAPVFDALRSLDLARVTSRADAEAHLAKTLPDAGVRQFLLKNLDRTGEHYRWKMHLDGLHAAYAAIRGDLQDLPPWATFDGPTRFIRGARSHYIADEDWPRIEARFPEANLVTIPGAGHWVHAEAPEPFAEAVTAFLRA